VKNGWLLAQLGALGPFEAKSIPFCGGYRLEGNRSPQLLVSHCLARQFSGGVAHQRMATFSRANDSGSPIGECLGLAFSVHIINTYLKYINVCL